MFADEQTKVAEKGCALKEEKKCDENKKKCKDCNEDKCNSATLAKLGLLSTVLPILLTITMVFNR